MTPMRSPSTPPLEHGPQARRGLGDRGGVERVVAADDLEQQRGVGDGRRRTDRSGRASSRTRPGRSATRVRRWASRRRRRTAPPAGGSSRRCRSPSASGANSAATAAADPPLEPPGTRSSACGLRVGPNAEFSVDEPIANSSRFVLPTAMPPAATTRSTTVAVYGGSQPSRIFELQVVGTPRVQRLSFSATGTPASAARVVAASHGGVDGVGRRQRRVRGHEVERVDVALPGVDRGRGAPRRPRGRAARRPARPRRARPRSRRLAQHRRDPEAVRPRRRAPPPAPRPGRGSGARSSARSTFTSGQRVGGRRDVAGVDGRDPRRRGRGWRRARR